MLQGVRPEAFEKVTDTEIKDIIRRCISTMASERYAWNEEYIFAVKSFLALFDCVSFVSNKS